MATTQPIKIQPRPNVKQINYLSKTFTDFRQNFIEFAKAYYPNTYADFNEASPGMMFIEMASYLGDVLSFYIDNQFKENLMAYAEQPENVVSISQFLGYKPKLVGAASTQVDLSIIVPRILDATTNTYIPNSLYLPQLAEGSSFTTNTPSATRFILTQPVDFRDITEEDYFPNSFTGTEPADFLVVKRGVDVIAASRKTTQFAFGSAQKFSTVTMPNESIVGIESVVDSNNNTWYEVDYLAQDVIMDDVQVSDNGEDGNMPMYGLRLKKVPRRFVTRVNRNFRVELMFGSGESNDSDVDVTVDSRQIANNQYGDIIANSVGNVALNNLNFLNSTAFGLSPSNTTLTVTYLVGGGVASNTSAGTITNVESLILLNDTSGYTAAEISQFNLGVQGLSVLNPLPATGGGSGESIEEIRENAMAFFNAQNRVVTVEDYVIRTHALPSKYGVIAKAYALRDEQLNAIMQFQTDTYVTENVRPYSVNLYTLGYDSVGNFTTLNTVTKNNLALYLEQFRMLTDDVNILDAFIINIGIDFGIRVFKNYNINDVLARVIGTIEDFFDKSKWSINQPIILADLNYAIGSVEGVQTITSLRIYDKYQSRDGLDYQNYRYDINEATENGIIYPSLDPSIFELKYPRTDIKGTATQ